MQLEFNAKTSIGRIAQKEITLFFSSPIAYLFLAAFAVVSLFVFFWGESFFARNISDVRPLFEWMPILLIFLSATLTMRLWSEERRSGTLEFVITQPVPLWHFVAGKFLACLFLLGLAVCITLPLPVSVAILADLDWGPVIAGYIATLFLGAAYLSIGLFVSARSDNQIVSLIAASALSGFLYLLGAGFITELFSHEISDWLRLLGSGSRFSDITRGVLDISDLYYYLSIILVFLALNTYTLEKERWVSGTARPAHRHWRGLLALFVVNALLGNAWLGQAKGLRVDMTEGNQYSISHATHSYLERLQEPLLIRGYFSSNTHPLLAPLVPQLRDLLAEYEIAGNGKVRTEFIDPIKNPELEEEANQKYGIKAVPFQVADRYQSSIVSSYFNILVQYGDEHEVLSFNDLIEVKVHGEGDIDVQLRNPEYDLTRVLKKVLHSYQASGNIFDTVQGNLEFKAYISSDASLPEQLKSFKTEVLELVNTLVKDSGERLKLSVLDPQEGDGSLAQKIAEDYGFQPMSAGLFSQAQFYFYLTLANDKQVVQIPLGELNKEEFERNLDAGLKRFATGFTKTIALVTPPSMPPQYAQYGQPNSSPRFNRLEQFLNADFKVESEDLSDGSVSGEADILVLAAPKDLDEKQLYAVDQFLMKGGTVLMATSPYSAGFESRRLSLQKYNSGIDSWLAHHGLTIDDTVVLDPQNTAFPVPVTRNVGGFQLQEMRMLDYPYYIDVRGDAINRDSLLTSELPQLTFAWASPIHIDEEKNSERELVNLVHSSDAAWTSNSLDIMPKVQGNGVSAFNPSGERNRHLLGLVASGRFNSYFAGKPSPLIDAPSEAKTDAEKEEVSVEGQKDEAGEGEETSEALQVDATLQRSPESARIILFSSNDFLRDQVLQLAGSTSQTEYLNTLQLIGNAVEWSLEDAGLLSIRSRGHFNRTLPPMEQGEQMFWEYLNYGLALFMLLFIALLERYYRRARYKHYQHVLAQ